jgi:hypothetical protein
MSVTLSGLNAWDDKMLGTGMRAGHKIGADRS